MEKAGQPEGKNCGGCGVWKVWDEFHKDRQKKDGYKHVCIACDKAYRKINVEAKKAYDKVYYKENAEKKRAWELRRKYGLTPAETTMLWNYCQNSCYLCGKPENGTKLHVDHDHSYPKGDKRGVRGLLCWTCNAHILPLFEKDANSYLLSKFTTAFYSKVFDYLRNPPAQKLLNIST